MALRTPFNIEVTRDSAVVTGKNTDGSTFKKTMALQDLCSVFASSASTREMIIPPGCRLIAEKGGTAFFVFTIPAFVGKCFMEWDHDDDRIVHGHNLNDAEFRVTDEEFGGDTDYVRKFSIPYPATAVVAKMLKKSDCYMFRDLWCFALHNDYGNVKDLALYKWPYSNVYSSNNVCIGDINSRFETIESIASLPNRIFNGVGNSDLSDSNNIMPQALSDLDIHGFGIYKFLSALHGTKSFNLSWLKPINLTLGEWLNAQLANCS